MFVAEVFHDTFHSLSHVQPQVLHPVPDCVNSATQSSQDCLILAQDVNTVFLSINRYERKKNIVLALEALGLLSTTLYAANSHREY